MMAKISSTATKLNQVRRNPNVILSQESIGGSSKPFIFTLGAARPIDFNYTNDLKHYSQAEQSIKSKVLYPRNRLVVSFNRLGLMNR